MFGLLWDLVGIGIRFCSILVKWFQLSSEYGIVCGWNLQNSMAFGWNRNLVSFIVNEYKPNSDGIYKIIDRWNSTFDPKTMDNLSCLLKIRSFFE